MIHHDSYTTFADAFKKSEKTSSDANRRRLCKKTITFRKRRKIHTLHYVLCNGGVYYLFY